MYLRFQFFWDCQGAGLGDGCLFGIANKQDALTMKLNILTSGWIYVKNHIDVVIILFFRMEKTSNHMHGRCKCLSTPFRKSTLKI